MKTMVLFNGQGSQEIGMGLDFKSELHQHYSEITKLIEDGPIELLNQTQNTQKAILLTSLVIYESVQNKIKPDFIGGLSLGEYAACVASGVLSLDDAMKIVSLRGELMAEALAPLDSKMSAVMSGDVELITKITNQANCFIANINSPTQIVISGLSKHVETAKELLREHKIRSIDLKVSGAFHSPYLDEASKKLDRFLSEFQFSNQKFPIIFNVSGQPSQTGIKELLVEQIKSPVLFKQSIEYAIQQGVEYFIEIGPGKALSGFIKKISPSTKIISINHPEDLKELNL